MKLTLRILVSLLLTLNIFHILRNVKNAKVGALNWKKESKVSLTDCKLKCFSSRIWAPPLSLHKSPPNIGQSNLSFVRIYAQGVLTGFYDMFAVYVYVFIF